jgi:hypothetical protein
MASWNLKVVGKDDGKGLGKLKYLKTMPVKDGWYILHVYDRSNVVKFWEKGTDHKTMVSVGEFPSEANALKAAERHAVQAGRMEPEGEEETPYHFGASATQPQADASPEEEEPSEGPPTASEYPPEWIDTTPAETGDGDEPTRIGVGTGDNPKGGKRKIDPSLPSQGSTHMPGGKIAPAAAGFRSAIERTSGMLQKFVDKYKGVSPVKPEKLDQMIKSLDGLPSDQILRTTSTIGNLLHQMYSEISAQIGEKVKEKHWKQKYPKHTEEEIRSFIRKAKRSEKYQKDSDARQKLDMMEGHLDEFFEQLDQKIKADPEFKELFDDYFLTSSALRVALSAGGKLATSTMGTQKADKIVGHKTGGGWSKEDPRVAPNDSTYAVTQKYRDMGAVPTEPSMKNRDADIDTLSAKDDLSRAEKERLKQLKYNKAKSGAKQNFTVHKKPVDSKPFNPADYAPDDWEKKESFERWLSIVAEAASAEHTFRWLDEI